jgi:hypothetical protein
MHQADTPGACPGSRIRNRRREERRGHPRAGLEPGEAVNLVREPDKAHDRNAIAVVTLGGERAGYLPREVAAERPGLVDAGIIRSAAQLVAAGEPAFDGAGYAMNPRLDLGAYGNRHRLDEYLAQHESPACAG